VLIQNDDGTYTGGPLDVLCLLHNVEARTYHAAFFEESPFPGPIPNVDVTKVVRLKCNMHNTEGSPNLKIAMGHLHELSAKIEVPPENIWMEPRLWNGSVGLVWVEPNWRN